MCKIGVLKTAVVLKYSLPLVKVTIVFLIGCNEVMLLTFLVFVFFSENFDTLFLCLGSRAREFFLLSNLPAETLSHIW